MVTSVSISNSLVQLILTTLRFNKDSICESSVFLLFIHCE